MKGQVVCDKFKFILVYHHAKYCFGRNKEEVAREWRRLYNEELYGLHFSPNIFRVIKWRIIRWALHVARMGNRRGAYRVSVGRPGGKRPLRRPRRKLNNNIKM